MPGGGAEVFSERVRKALFKQKIGAERWLEIHRIAHRMGIRTNSTLLYGHIETYEERVQHCIRLRDLEDEAPGFFAFIPLAFQPGYTDLVERQASAIEDLRTIAMSRLVFDNVPHVKSYWVMLGEETASLGAQLRRHGHRRHDRRGEDRARRARSLAARASRASAWST